MQWFTNFIIVLDEKFDGSQKLRLANYTRYTVYVIFLYVHVCMHEVCVRVCMAMMCVQHVYVLNFVYAYMYMSQNTTSSNCNVGRYVPILVSIAC